MKLSRSSNNVLSGFLGITQNHRIGLGKTLHSLNKLGEISRVLGLNSTTNNGGYRELHGLDCVSVLFGTDGSGLKKILVNSYQSASVSSRNIGYLLSVPSHHDHSTLNVLNPKISLLTRLVVGSHDAHLLSSGNSSRKDTTESIETSLIGGGNHLGNVHTKRSTLGSITCTNSGGSLVIERSLIKSIYTVCLCLCGRGQVEHNHLKNSVSCGKPLLHDTLQKSLSDEFLLI
mmetsp:Transcript_14701/g.27655  ORF Transcript_14701/g.27655 Transcript_14701/m.27655 type:complete len:231 (+) Transcript_14701:985-1677(+)